MTIHRRHNPIHTAIGQLTEAELAFVEDRITPEHRDGPERIKLFILEDGAVPPGCRPDLAARLRAIIALRDARRQKTTSEETK